MSNTSKNKKSRVLKYALFATGLSGIVAEYILSTLASYYIGNTVMQFTLIMSIMLFSMGLGSRLSRYFNKELIESFIFLELGLSFFSAFSALAIYLTYSSTNASWILIYTLSIVIGLMIGLEIPLVTRINDSYEELKTNISSVLENDYYGSLAGGLFFAFIGLPFLGLTHTPFVLAGINFLVALWVFVKFNNLIRLKNKTVIQLGFLLVGLSILFGGIFAERIVMYGEQKKYKDRIVLYEQTKYQKIVLTQWKNEHSLYINNNHQLSTFDEFLYHEPMVHSIMQLAKQKQNVLVLGGGDGCAVREILKYSEVEKITLVDLDQKMIEIAQNHHVFLEMNKGSLNDDKVSIVIDDAFSFLDNCKQKFDVIIIDLPDPNNLDLNKLYTKDFYYICYNHLNREGLLITQSGSPYYATKAFYCIEKSLREAGFNTLPMHNEVISMGHWGWVLASPLGSKEELVKQMRQTDFDKLSLRWLNNEAINYIISFGKPLVDISDIETNTVFNPVLYKYYVNGIWHLY